MEVKIVVNYKDGKAVVGVNSPGCDPVFEMVEGDLLTILSNTATLTARAQEKWKTSPKNPTIDLPKPSAPVEAAAAKSSAKLVPPATNTTQPVMF